MILILGTADARTSRQKTDSRALATNFILTLDKLLLFMRCWELQ